MSTVHRKSEAAILPNFNIFNSPPTQQCVEKCTDIIHRPIATLSSSAPIEIPIPTTVDRYVDLSELQFRLKLRIRVKKASGEDGVTGDYAAVSPINYLLHTIFKSVELKWGDKVLTNSPQHYGIRSYIETLLGASQTAKKTFLTSAGWYDEKNDRIALIKPKNDAEAKTGKLLYLIGRPHFDLSFQNRFLIGGAPLMITLIPHDPSFYLEAPSTVKVEVIFENFDVVQPSHKVTNSLLSGHIRGMEKHGAALYAINRVEIKPVQIGAGYVDANVDNLVSGIQPRRLIIGFVANENWNGSYATNPLKFENFKLKFLCAYLNGEKVPDEEFTPDFTNNIFTREYYNLYRILNQNTSSPVLNITSDQFKKSCCLFPISLSPSLRGGCGVSNFVSPQETGVLRARVVFEEALSVAVNMFCFLEYDSIIEVDGLRNIQTDYNG